jgi:hypothetical protein
MNNIVSIVGDLNKIRIMVDSGELVLSVFDRVSLAKLIGTASELLISESVSQDDEKFNLIVQEIPLL